MGCQKLTYNQEPAISVSWRIFTPDKKKTVSTSNFCIDYYTFGMLMPNRQGGNHGRYLFNGMEHDGEVSGDGNSYTTEFRQYDARLGRWKSLDALMHMFPWMSPYVAFDNNPVYFTDPYGLSSESGGDGHGEPVKTGEKAEPGEMKDKDGNRIDFIGKEITISPTIKQQQNSQPTEVVPPYDKNKSETTQAVGGVLNDPLRQSEIIADLKQKSRIAEFYRIEQKNKSSVGPVKNPATQNAEFALDMWGKYGDFIAPKEFIEKLYRGEEIDASDWIIEGFSFIPGGKIFGNAGKVFLKYGGDKIIDISKKKIIPVCFIAGTQIAIEVGLKPIEEIQLGDLVWAFDEETRDVALKIVYNTVIRETDHLEKLVIGSDTLYTTSDHPFWVSDTWRPAGDLVVGDTLTLRNNDKLILNYKEKIDTVATVYNFAVTDYATYYVGEQGILVHNNNPCATVIKKVNTSQVNKMIQKGKAPKTITRADKGKIYGEMDHIHFSDGSALNVNGTWKHGGKTLTNAEKKFLIQNNYVLPK